MRALVLLVCLLTASPALAIGPEMLLSFMGHPSYLSTINGNSYISSTTGPTDTGTTLRTVATPSTLSVTAECSGGFDDSAVMLEVNGIIVDSLSCDPGESLTATLSASVLGNYSARVYGEIYGDNASFSANSFHIPGALMSGKPPAGTALRTDGHWSVTGLVGAWPFNEGTGAPKDVVNNATGTVTGATWSGGDMLFTNNTDAITFPDRNSYDVSGNMTVVTAFYVASAPGGLQVPFGRQDYSQRFILNGFEYTGTQKITSEFGTSLDAPLTGDNKGKWITYVYTCDSTAGQKVYVNGTSAGSNASTNGSFVNTNLVKFGSSVSGAYPFHGLVKYTYLYNRTLSASEISSLYANPWQMFVGY